MTGGGSRIQSLEEEVSGNFFCKIFLKESADHLFLKKSYFFIKLTSFGYEWRWPPAPLDQPVNLTLLMLKISENCYKTFSPICKIFLEEN